MARKILTVIFIIVIAFTLFCSIGYIASNKLETEEITVLREETGGEGRGSGVSDNDAITIVHLSDTHFPYNSVDEATIIKTVKSASPDFIVLTGDVMDGTAKKEDVLSLKPFLNELSTISTCYLVIGNHEIGSDYLWDFTSTCSGCGINVLMNATSIVNHKNKKIAFIGLSDAYPYNEKVKGFDLISSCDYKILLAHRPEKFSSYLSISKPSRPNLIFAGHAHGGLIRLGAHALYAPNQGLFPKYTSGLYQMDGSLMVVSRGLSSNSVDLRLFNKYHIPIIHLKI